MKVEGDFTTGTDARRAVEALRAAGVPDDHIRMAPLDRHTSPDRGDRKDTKAETEGAGVYGGIGSVLTGIMVVGAGGREGPAWTDRPPHIGMRLVVDTETTGLDPQEVSRLLRTYRAANIRETETDTE